MSSPRALSAHWRAKANEMSAVGALAQAATFEFCANELEAALGEIDDELLNLQQAAAESGYSADHLGRLVKCGTIRNAGRLGSPRIARRDLPMKPGVANPAVAHRSRFPQPSKTEIVRSAIGGGE